MKITLEGTQDEIIAYMASFKEQEDEPKLIVADFESFSGNKQAFTPKPEKNIYEDAVHYSTGTGRDVKIADMNPIYIINVMRKMALSNTAQYLRDDEEWNALVYWLARKNAEQNSPEHFTKSIFDILRDNVDFGKSKTR